MRLLLRQRPACRYAEHKKILAFYEKEVFYYQGTKFIDQVERLLSRKCAPTSAAPRWRPVPQRPDVQHGGVLRPDGLEEPPRPQARAKRLGYVMNNHIIKGGHLSAQPMGALHDYIAVDPVTRSPPW